MGRGRKRMSAALKKKLQDELLVVRASIRDAYTRMTQEGFKTYVRDGLEMDEATATDILEWDGSIEGMTDRMRVYFEAPRNLE
jgi:hypothetical protein